VKKQVGVRIKEVFIVGLRKKIMVHTPHIPVGADIGFIARNRDRRWENGF
jgi:hypothetical protein